MISHKLNEITAIADTHDRHPRRPDRRDARHARRRGRPRSGSSAAWSAATWRASTPTASRTPGEEVLRDRGLDRAGIPTQDRKVVDGANLNVRARRGRRHRRADGRRPHRAGDERLRPLLRPRHHRPALHARQGDPGPHRRRGDRPRHRLRHRGPQAVRPEPHRGHPAQHLRGRACDKLAPRGWVNGNEEIKVAEDSRREHEHQGAERDVASSASSPAATSRRSCCPSGCSPTPTC